MWALDLLALTGRRRNAALAPARFEPMRDAQWKAIAAIVESTRGHCGGRCDGPRTDLRRTVNAIRWVLQTGAK